jgi:hypothetical protein
MGALTVKKERYVFRPWRLQEDRMIDFTDNFPYLVSTNAQDVELTTIRPTFNWLADGARVSLKHLHERLFYNTKAQYKINNNFQNNR